MAKPAASYITVPFDGSNLGKSVRYNRRVVAGQTVHEQVFVFEENSAHNGVYYCNLGTPSAIIAAAHDGTSTGFFWVENPVANTGKRINVMRIAVTITNNVAGAIDHDSAPRILFSRATFTGAFSGATATIAKRKTADATFSGSVRTAMTDAIISLVGPIFTALVPGVDLTTSDMLNIQSHQEWKPKFEDEIIQLAAGECLVCWQADNGTTNDQRVAMFQLTLEDIDIT